MAHGTFQGLMPTAMFYLPSRVRIPTASRSRISLKGRSQCTLPEWQLFCFVSFLRYKPLSSSRELALITVYK